MFLNCERLQCLIVRLLFPAFWESAYINEEIFFILSYLVSLI